MAFPLLLFLIFASARVSSSLQFVNYSWVVPKGVFAEAVLIGLFTSFYPTRLIRAHLLTLRSAEFVEASHMIGASNRRIMWRQLLPHVVPTLLVWSAIAVGTNILLEVGLSFIGVGMPAGRAHVRIAPLDVVGDDLRAAPVQQRVLHAVADDLPDRRDPDHGRVAEPALRGRPARHRALVASDEADRSPTSRDDSRPA